MKWTVDIAVAAVGTAAVWIFFRAMFPSDPLTLGQTVFVVAVIYGAIKAIRFLLAYLRPDKTAHQPEQDS